MKKSFAVLGLGRFGLKLVEELNRHSVDIIALDMDEANVMKAGQIISNAYICDITNESALRELGIENVDHAIVALGSNLQVTIMVTIILKEFGVKRITVRVDDDYYINVMLRLGATDTVSPQKLAGIRLANKIVSDSFIDYFNISSDYCIVEIKIQEHVKPVTIQELNPRNNYNVNLLLIHRDTDVFPAKATDELLPNDTIFVFGDKNSIAKFDSIINE